MVKTLLKVITIKLLLVNLSFAYHPTLESLLQNGSNVEIGKNSVVANLVIKDRSLDSMLEVTDQSSLNNLFAIKLHLFNENEENPLMTRVHYKAGVLSPDALVSHHEFKLSNMNKSIGHTENYDAEIFYGLMSYLLNNKGMPLLKALKKMRPAIKPNNELIDPEKIELLGKYKEYLIKKREDKETEVENPLKPADPELRLKVREIMKRPFLVKDPVVKRLKSGKEFFWVVEDENLFMKFDKEHNLLELKVVTALGDIEAVLGKYGVWGSQMVFPEFIMFKTSDQKWFEIKPKKVNMFPDNKSQYEKRLKKYSKHVEENNIVEPQTRPSFLL